jgi:proteasome lid subunit RPN8/RPN11
MDELLTEHIPHYGKRIVIFDQAVFQPLIELGTKYGNESIAREDWKMVMGVFMGDLSGDSVIVYEAVPLSYGTATEVNSSEEDVKEFERKDALYGEKGLFVVGWFHTRFQSSLHLSLTDSKNQKGWQDTNPDAFAMVYDPHTVEQGIPNFEIYRLKNIEMSVDNPKFINNHHTVKYEIHSDISDFRLLKAEGFAKQRYRQVQNTPIFSFNHARRVVVRLLKFTSDFTVLCAGFMHDMKIIARDTNLFSEIEANFGKPVVELVEEFDKIKTGESNGISNFDSKARLLFLAEREDHITGLETIYKEGTDKIRQSVLDYIQNFLHIMDKLGEPLNYREDKLMQSIKDICRSKFGI